MTMTPSNDRCIKDVNFYSFPLSISRKSDILSLNVVTTRPTKRYINDLK